jgi:hypothetical protein
MKYSLSFKRPNIRERACELSADDISHYAAGMLFTVSQTASYGVFLNNLADARGRTESIFSIELQTLCGNS